MTIILTLIGIVVFVVSLFGPGLKVAFSRLITFVVAGVALDVLVYFTLASMMAMQVIPYPIY